MADAATLPVLDLNVLIAMYGDDSAETITLALSGFRREATVYVQQLQNAGQHNIRTDSARKDHNPKDTAMAEIALLFHSLKSMSGLVCDAKLMQ